MPRIYVGITQDSSQIYAGFLSPGMWVGKPVLPSDYLLPFSSWSNFGLVVSQQADLDFIIRVDIHADPKIPYEENLASEPVLTILWYELSAVF